MPCAISSTRVPALRLDYNTGSVSVFAANLHAFDFSVTLLQKASAKIGTDVTGDIFVISTSIRVTENWGTFSAAGAYE